MPLAGMMTLAFLTMADITPMVAPSNAITVVDTAPLHTVVIVPGKLDKAFKPGDPIEFSYKTPKWDRCVVKPTYEEVVKDDVAIKSGDYLSMSCYQDGQEDAVWTQKYDIPDAPVEDDDKLCDVTKDLNVALGPRCVNPKGDISLISGGYHKVGQVSHITSVFFDTGYDNVQVQIAR